MTLVTTMTLVTDERLGNDFEDNKKMFWKEVKRERKGEQARDEIVKDVNCKYCVMV